MTVTGLPAGAPLGDSTPLEAEARANAVKPAKAGARARALATLPAGLREIVGPAMAVEWVNRVTAAEAVRQSEPWQGASAAERVLAAWLLRTMDAADGGANDVPVGMSDAVRATLGRVGADARWVDPAGMDLDTQPFGDEDLVTLTKNPPPREWLIDRLIPHGRLSSLYGVGEAGKSRLVLQLAAAVIAGSGPMIALDPEAGSGYQDLATLGDVPVVKRQGRVLLVTWEDEPVEISWRWKMAHAADAIASPYPGDGLRVLNMRAVGGPLWAPHASGTRHTSTAGEWTASGRRLLASLRGFTLCVIDPIAAAYACSEIDRALVRAFCSAIDGEAERAGCTVILVGHPPKTGEPYSGNTDWYSAPRAMLTLGNVASGYSGPDSAEVIDAPCLMRHKGSYGRGGRQFWLRDHWIPAEDEKPAELAWFATTAQRAAAAAAGTDRADTVASEGRTRRGGKRKSEKPPAAAATGGGRTQPRPSHLPQDIA